MITKQVASATIAIKRDIVFSWRDYSWLNRIKVSEYLSLGVSYGGINVNA